MLSKSSIFDIEMDPKRRKYIYINIVMITIQTKNKMFCPMSMSHSPLDILSGTVNVNILLRKTIS